MLSRISDQDVPQLRTGSDSRTSEPEITGDRGTQAPAWLPRQPRRVVVEGRSGPRYLSTGRRIKGLLKGTDPAGPAR